jgi:hypothetical protein
MSAMPRASGRLRCIKKSEDEQSFGNENHDVVNLQMEHGGRRSGTSSMLSVLTSASIFYAGLIVGLALSRSRGRRERAHRDASRRSTTPTTTFGHARRAF